MNHRILLLLILFSFNAFAEAPHVLAQLPAHELKLGDLIEIPINIVSDDMEIVSYGVELRFDPTQVRFIDVRPGLTPMYYDQPMFRQNGRNKLSITGSARSFGRNQKIINVANLKFELIAENVRPRFELAQTGPTVRKEGFAAVEARYSVEGKVDLYNFLFEASFE